MRITVVHNRPDPPAAGDWLAGIPKGAGPLLHHVADLEVLEEVEVVRASLASVGHEVTVFEANDPETLCRFLRTLEPDLVFNCCEAFAGRSDLEMSVAGLYDLIDVPYTGSSSLTLGLALNKPMAKAVLTAAGIATPAYAVLASEDDFAQAEVLGFPLIVKPAAEDCSVGIDDRAVVADRAALADRARFIWKTFRQAALAEQFIAGRELHVSVLACDPVEFHTLPIVEISFDSLPPGRPHILGYEAKWNPKADFTQGEAVRCPTSLEVPLEAEVRRLACAAARALGLRDYGRIDLRLRESDGALFVLEANPNPDLSPDCTFLTAARASGRTDASAICEIVERAAERRLRSAWTRPTQI